MATDNELLPVFVGPTDNITKVANAIFVRTNSTKVTVNANPGIAVPNPVNVTVQFVSPQIGTHDEVQQRYDYNRGLEIKFLDNLSSGWPRPVHLTITLTETKPGIGKWTYTMPASPPVTVTPLFRIVVTEGKFEVIDNCDEFGGENEIHLGWRAPDKSWHEKSFGADTKSIYNIKEFDWEVSGLTRAAFQSALVYPTVGFWEKDPFSVGVVGPFVQPGNPLILPDRNPMYQSIPIKNIAEDSGGSCRGFFSYKIFYSPYVN